MTRSRSLRIAVVAGELSGDQLGGELIGALRAECADLTCFGMAGPAMMVAGCDAYAHVDELSVMGLFEVLRSYPRLRRLRARLVERIAEAAPDVFVGIDVPDFNLGLARQLKARGIRTVQYVCPQVWAWRQGRAARMHHSVDRLLAMFPFEPAFFSNHGVDTVFVGHPLADRLPLSPDRGGARAALGLPDATPVVALLPGSREQELARLLRPFVESAQLLHRTHPRTHFVMCLAHARQVARVRSYLAEVAAELPCTVVQGVAHQALTAADVSLLASGTVTLEALLCGTPMVVGYRLSAASYPIIRSMVKIPHIALPNIIAGRALVPELIQNALTPASASAALAAWLDNPAVSADFVRESRRMHAELRCDASRAAARAILELADR